MREDRGYAGRDGSPAGGGPGQGSTSQKPLRAAVPDYLGGSFETAPPGHRFRLYFAGWNEGWELDKNRKNEAASSAVSLPSSSLGGLRAIRDRQRRLASDNHTLSVVEGVTSAPFTTGLGIEHPLEIGFAFLDPYGLPYLPGSSVKGVLRRAAEELALFETDRQGWSVPAIWWLFGFDSNSAFFVPDRDEPKPIIEERRRWREGLGGHLDRLRGGELDLLDQYVHLACTSAKGSSASAVERVCMWIPHGGRAVQEIREIHTRGAIELWDVIPEPKDGKLRVDIINPHYEHYYQQGKPPGDWGSPKPNYFLTLPPGTRFTFIARFRPPINWPDPVRRYFETTEDGVARWKSLVGAALTHAFDWLGFGAKTAVGYGRMSTLTADEPTNPSAGVTSGSAPRQSSRPLPQQRDGAEPEAAADLSPELERIGQLLQSLKNPATESAQVERLVNELARHYKHPAAAQLAAALWNKLKTVPWLASKVRKQPVFWQLVQKGGGT